MLMFWVQQIILIMSQVQGMNWCGCCFGRCGTDKVDSFSNQSPTQHHNSFMNLNDSSESTLCRDTTTIAASPKFVLSSEISYQSCNTIVNDLPYSWSYDSESVRDQLIRKCTRRWHELSGDVRVDPSILYRPSDSRTSNLIVFKLDRTVVDTKLVASHAYPPTCIRKYNKHDLVFNQMEHRYPSHHHHHHHYNSFLSHSYNHRVSGLIKKLAIYRQGFMEILHALRSGKLSNKSFDIGVYGDGGDSNDVLFHAVAIETYFNWQYLRTSERRLFRKNKDRFQELQLNFVFAAEIIDQSWLERYDRLLLVYSDLSAGVLDVFSRFDRIKIKPFDLGIMDKQHDPRHDVLYDLYNRRSHEDKTMEYIEQHIMDLDVMSRMEETEQSHNNTISPLPMS